MDLICTIYTPSKKDAKTLKGPLQSKWCYESANLCAVSSQNALLFTSSFPLDTTSNAAYSDFSTALPTSIDPTGQGGEKMGTFNSKSVKLAQVSNDGSASNCLHHIFVADLNTPWDVHRVTSRASEITSLTWDPDTSSGFILSDKDGTIEAWQMIDNVLTEWKCTVRTHYPGEMFIKAKFIPHGRRVYLNLDRLDSHLFSDKFAFRQASGLSNQFGRHDLTCCVLVSHTGLAVALTFPMMQDLTSEAQDSRGINSGLRTRAQSLSHARCRIKHADITFLKDGTLIAATSNGDPKSQVRFFSLIPEMTEFDDKHSLHLKVETFPGLFLQSHQTTGAKGLAPVNDEDSCQAIVGLRFVTGDDFDTILVASHHPSGGRVELWELREMPHLTNKMFQMGSTDAAHTKKLVIPAWHYIEVFNGPAAQVMCLSTPLSVFQTGRAAACYVTVAYSDGSIQCLLRDSLQQIGSADLPKTGNLCEDPSAKMARTSVTICDMSFTATGNALVAVDSLGQLYVYRMSPISDPGGLHSPVQLVTMLEYCLVSGHDWWDLTICAKPAHIDPICERLANDFNIQPSPIQQFYSSRFMMIKSSILGLSCSDFKSSDTHNLLILQSVYYALKALLRPGDPSMSEQGVIEKITSLLSNNRKDESDVDKLVMTFQPILKELQIESKQLQPFQHLIQWICNLTLHLMASVPEYHHQKGPGMTLANDKLAQNMIRELLLLIRIWGGSHEGILPSYTKTTDSFDVISKLFSLITRYKENPIDETLQDECIMLPSQVMVPPLNTSINAKGISPIVVLSYNLSPIAFEFSRHDVLESSSNSNFNKSLVEGSFASHQVIDCIRQIYLGRRPYAAKQCTRCCAMTLPNSGKDSLNPVWEKRWLRKCPCGGPWKLSCLEE